MVFVQSMVGVPILTQRHNEDRQGLLKLTWLILRSAGLKPFRCGKFDGMLQQISDRADNNGQPARQLMTDRQ